MKPPSTEQTMLKFVTAKVGILANSLDGFLLSLSLPDSRTDTQEGLKEGSLVRWH
jgi:hypothetical protein